MSERNVEDLYSTYRITCWASSSDMQLSWYLHEWEARKWKLTLSWCSIQPYSVNTLTATEQTVLDEIAVLGLVKRQQVGWSKGTIKLLVRHNYNRCSNEDVMSAGNEGAMVHSHQISSKSCYESFWCFKSTDFRGNGFSTGGGVMMYFKSIY
jgi:hypothetical protein